MKLLLKTERAGWCVLFWDCNLRRFKLQFSCAGTFCKPVFRQALSPSRLQQRKIPKSPKKAETLSPSRLSFLPDSGNHRVKTPSSDSTSPFNESWPSTEHSSSSLTPEGAKALPSIQASGTKTLASRRSPESVLDSESVIAKYIERFRYGQPTNRRERWTPHGHSAQFWWFGHSLSPEGNTLKKEASPSSDNGQGEAQPSSFSPLLDRSPSGESQDTSTLDPETVNLQERAARLLQRSASPTSSSRQVSSEGLSSTSTLTNADADLVGRAPQHLVGHQSKGSLGTFPYHITQLSQSCSSLKQEDDILFQWRLRRKMEEASKAAAMLPPVTWRNQCSQPTCVPNMMEGAALKLPELTVWRSNVGRTLPTSEAQLDVKTIDKHPCCCTGPMRNDPSSGHPTETALFRTSNPAVRSPEPTGEQEPAPQGDPISVYPDSLLPPRPSETSRPLDQSTLPHAQRAVQPVEQLHSEPRGPLRPFQVERSRAKPARAVGEPPASPHQHPVQHVLGEVIAERLFSPPESPALHRDKQKRRSAKNRGQEEVLPETVATPSHPQLLSMAAQLLEQAEDSDGTEFEDDPLLQVLRGQRDLLRSQLWAVDVRVTQLERSHSDQNFSCP
ncbi:proline and serine-rich protein 3 isoform X2 [Hemicordylus capensis]|uniref:proline and serine-rich protein 3 isoform X2 n=1 Tax=Hemicordylus capensis TaxID=884348 RepID=UPI002303CD90|nr:proline and serine-rich protein 3 isoform X2 [Hemicordylus capensis]XP_053124396.1 proline and serine-rich protein 3 isoform X2 [Hemicordylus capensis]XP_053124397.1 proline and serine-rich protein 3 isoform X2 [Hemicordylus capensis]